MPGVIVSRAFVKGVLSRHQVTGEGMQVMVANGNEIIRQ